MNRSLLGDGYNLFLSRIGRKGMLVGVGSMKCDQIGRFFTVYATTESHQCLSFGPKQCYMGTSIWAKITHFKYKVKVVTHFCKTWATFSGHTEVGWADRILAYS